MTLTSIIPDLDDITFDNMVEDGRGFIPRYAPDWSDHNLHDPGITLIDLIAHLTDQQIYRIGHVGDSLKAAVARLLGVREEGPEGAKLLIWPTQDSVALDLVKGASLTSPDLPDAAYTLDADVRMVASEIAALKLVTGEVEKGLGVGLTQGRDPIVLWPHAGGGPRVIEVELAKEVLHQENAGLLSLGIAIGEPLGCKGPSWGDVAVEQYDPAGFWRPLETDDQTLGLRQTGTVLFRPLKTVPLRRFRVRLDQGFRPASVTISRMSMNVLPATEGREMGETQIGEGTGLPDQNVMMVTDDIVDREAMGISSTSADGLLEWKLVTHFEDSGPDDTHVVLTPDGLRFGNALNGRVVPSGGQILLSPLRRTCGAEGAVARGLIWQRNGQTIGTNISPSSAGKARDTLSDLLRRARVVAKRRHGQLRAEAIEDALSVDALGLSDVQVAPRRKPGLEDISSPGNRTVLVIPTRDPKTAPPPATAELRDAVTALLAPSRIMGERLHVSLPMYREVDVAVALLIEADANVQEIELKAENLIRQRLWDLRMHEDQDITPWPAGRPVTVGEIASLVAEIAEVVRVTDCQLGAGDGMSARSIDLSDREIALARTVSITVALAVEGEIS